MGVLLDCSIRMVLIAAVVAAVIGGFRIRGARARHTAWCGVLAVMLLLPAFSLWGPKPAIRILPAVTEPSPIDPWIPVVLQSAESLPARPLNVQPALVEPPSLPATPPLDLLFTAYLAGAGFLLIRLLLGTIQAVRFLRRASPEQQNFLSSGECACPVTAGWLRPSIVLPLSWKEWPLDELNVALAHEREHARKRDPLVQWLAALNRCVFWFHPLAWWLERKLAMLAEEACDAAVVANGHDPHDYSEYLLNQARAIQRAGSRVALHGSAMGRGVLQQRMLRLLDQRTVPEVSRKRAMLAVALSFPAIVVFTACQLDRVEEAAPGQPTMNELMHRRADEGRQWQAKQDAIVKRAHALTPAEAQSLAAKLKENPDDEDTQWALIRHYEFRQNVKDLDALHLWYIEHRPGSKSWTGNINPQMDRAGYDRGKALWLAHIKRPGASPQIYQRAADFLEGADRPLAESAIRMGQKAYPNETRWASSLGRHYAQALIGSGEPMTEFNVFRSISEPEARSTYAQGVRAQLDASTDVPVLVQTAQNLMAWGSQWGRDGKNADLIPLARKYLDRALSIQPDSGMAKLMQSGLVQVEQGIRFQRLQRMTSVDLASISDSDRMLLTLARMRIAWRQGHPDESAAKAREVLDFAGHHQGDPLYGDAVFEAHIVLGKMALRRGDRKAAVRDLMAAADTPGSMGIRQGHFEMNLPRALIDRGERRTVADFLDRMAPKTVRTQQYQEWAAQIRKGINPDLIPTYSMPGCTQDPC